MMLDSWFSRVRSTLEMVAGTKNDAVAQLKFKNNGEFILAPVGIKTKVSHERIAKAEAIVARHNTVSIQCNVDDDIWNECVKPDHCHQLMVQIIVL